MLPRTLTPVVLKRRAAAVAAITTTFAGDDAGITYGGRWSTPFGNAGITIIPPAGIYSEIRTVVTGAQCRMRIFADGSTHRWTVDGGAEQTDSTGGNVNAWVTLFTGLSDGPHTVVKYNGNYTGYSEMFEVTGAAPAIAAQAGYTNTTYRIGDASGLSEDNSTANTSTEGYDKIRDRGSFRFKATTATVRVWCRNDVAGAQVALITDATPSTIVRASPPDNWGWVSFTGLDSGAEHTYRVVVARNCYCYAVMVPGGTLNTTALTALPADYWQGDSITGASNITNGDCALNFPQRYGILTNRGWQIEGTPGGTAFTQGQAQKANPGAASPAVTRVFLAWGINDQAGGSGVSTANFRTAMDAITAKIHTDLSGSDIYGIGILPVSAATSRASYNTEMSASMAGVGGGKGLYLNTDSLATVSTSDGTHPDATGAAAVGDYLVAQVP